MSSVQGRSSLSQALESAGALPCVTAFARRFEWCVRRVQAFSSDHLQFVEDVDSACWFIVSRQADIDARFIRRGRENWIQELGENWIAEDIVDFMELLEWLKETLREGLPQPLLNMWNASAWMRRIFSNAQRHLEIQGLVLSIECTNFPYPQLSSKVAKCVQSFVLDFLVYLNQKELALPIDAAEAENFFDGLVDTICSTVKSTCNPMDLKRFEDALQIYFRTCDDSIFRQVSALLTEPA